MSDINIVLENRDDIHVAVEEKDINVEVPAGKDGRSLRPRGEWSASAAYAYLDLVSYQGSSYVATKAVPAGTLPTDTSYWMLSAEKGEPGGAVWGNIAGDLSDQTDLQNALDNKAPVILSSASGSIASFSDGSASPVTALSVGIEPVQDLHGYDNPWPAGGGKNLIDDTGNIWTENYYINSEGAIISSTYYKYTTDLIPISASTAYYVQCYKNSTVDLGISVAYYDDSDNFISREMLIITTARGVIGGTFTTPVNTKSVRITCPNESYNIQLEKGTVKTSYAPYSNICPISGRTSATVTRTGKNLLIKSSLTEPWDGVAGNNFTRTAINNYNQISLYGTDGLHFKTGTSGNAGGNGVGFKINLEQFGIKIGDVVTFSASIKGTVTGSIATGLKYYHSTPSSNTYYATSVNFYNIQNFSATEWQRVSGSFTVADTGQGSNKGYAYIIPSIGFNAELYIKDIQLEFGSVANPYEDNNKVVLTIDLDGTRYGGVLNVLTGEMVVTWVKVVFDGSNRGKVTYKYPNKYCFNITTNLPQGALVKTPNNNSTIGLISDMLTNLTDNVIYNGNNTGIATSTNGNFSKMGLAFLEPESVTVANDWLAEHPITVIAPLAEPLTVQLTPSQLSTLLGQNNIWADTGDVAVEYRADTKRYIDGVASATAKVTRQMIADSATADGKAPKSLATGDLIIVGDELRKATTNIGNGSAITASNSTTATLADVIKALQ